MPAVVNTIDVFTGSHSTAHQQLLSVYIHTVYNMMTTHVLVGSKVICEYNIVWKGDKATAVLEV